ncbi:MAG TPA: SpoIIE family protein phosphatase [Candidatus Ventricola gallistercoris]|nr:SpoIIE family protein phosphatase [Candidatus Ventricola gallistercoris]
MAEHTIAAGSRRAGVESDAPGGFGVFLQGIERTLRIRGTLVQRVLCAALMALLTGAALPGGGYACQIAMFAVVLRLGFCVPAAFVGIMAGFAAQYGLGDLSGCWQLPAATLLWLSTGLWAQRSSRMRMAAAVFLVQLTGVVVMGMTSVLSVAVVVLSAAASAGLSVLYDGAALSVCHRDELDGETRPLCVVAVCASLAAGILPLPGGYVIAGALAAYLTLEHAYVGGAQQAILCAGVVGGVVSLGQGSLHTCAMLLCGGFLAGEIKTQRRSVCALLMLCGMAAAGALLGGDMQAVRLLAYALPGFAPFLVLSSVQRTAVTGLIEREVPEEMTQSEAVAVRSASMIHAWANLYEDTARMMEGLGASGEENPLVCQCVQLLQKTSAAAHQVCERTLSEIHPDDDAYRRVRYALLRAGFEQVRVAYALRIAGRMEVMLLKPEHVAPVMLSKLVADGCRLPMRACAREGLLSTQAVFEQSPALEMEIGAATRSRSGEEVAGDSYVSRALAGGRHVLALSDGMGSGVSARQESHAALRLMVESLRAGYTRAQALDVVNALMLMCTGREMYATMDLCVCDLHSGETAFEKLGACASYVVRDGEVRAIGADTLPVGVLPEVESRSLRMTLVPGDVVVMLTDGVCDAYPGGEAALREAIGKLAWLHPQAVGEKLIAQAMDGGVAGDDMTVLCAKISKSTLE